MSITIAVDFDGTLHTGKFPAIGAPRHDVLEALITSAQRGHALILHTCRKGLELDEAVLWCEDHGLDLAAVWNGPGKPTADFYLDDRAIRPQEFVMSRDNLGHLASARREA